MVLELTCGLEVFKSDIVELLIDEARKLEPFVAELGDDE